MLHKTRGVVLRFTKYGETSIIVNIFTEIFGLQSYIVNGIRSKSAKGKIALYQPLTLLDLVVYYKENANIHRIKDVKCHYAYQTIHSDIRKSTIAMFIVEVINKTARDESHAHELCEFLVTSLTILDTQVKEIENFHIIFLLKLSRFLGFGARGVQDILHGRFTDPSIEIILQSLLNGDYNNEIKVTSSQRREMLDLTLRFYREHIETFGEMKSINVLREILN